MFLIIFLKNAFCHSFLLNEYLIDLTDIYLPLCTECYLLVIRNEFSVFMSLTIGAAMLEYFNNFNIHELTYHSVCYARLTTGYAGDYTSQQKLQHNVGQVH